MTSGDGLGVRDPGSAGRLLVVERDVLAHCSAAVMRVVENRFEEGVFSPESNDRDIAERADWSPARIVDELERGMTEAGPVIAEAGGALDGIALGAGVPPRL